MKEVVPEAPIQKMSSAQDSLSTVKQRRFDEDQLFQKNAEEKLLIYKQVKKSLTAQLLCNQSRKNFKRSNGFDIKLTERGESFYNNF